MPRLPVIVSIGGINPAGRISCHHAFRRMVIDALDEPRAAATWQSLATLMGRAPEDREFMRAHTLIRRIEPGHFDVDHVPVNHAISLSSTDGNPALRFEMPVRRLPDPLPPNWRVERQHGGTACVQIDGTSDAYLPGHRVSRVQAAGMLPTGFDPAALYPSRNHPRGLQMAIFAASDALGSSGLDWDTVRNSIAPDQLAVFAASAMSQLDQNGYAGLLQAGPLGKRATSKQLPLGLPEMPADFVNAYVLGSVGATGANIGACATFLYNLNLAVEEIRSGRRRIAFAGAAEAPVTPEVIEGYRTMGALAEDEALMALDGTERADHRRACRPFADNAGFTLAESSVYTMLMDHELALALGAPILGAVPAVFINADGYKKSIPGPGVGNYLTVARALDVARGMLGADRLARTFMHAHGTGTPQNRVTESHIMSELSGTFGLGTWPIAAIKAFVGHSLGPAGGDQLAATLGTWAEGVLPGIRTIDRIADDVHRDGLRFMLDHEPVGRTEMDAAFINSKGFGGNNATGVVLAPHVVERMLERRIGRDEWSAYRQRREHSEQRRAAYDTEMSRKTIPPRYRFGEGVVEGAALKLGPDAIHVPGFDQPVALSGENPFPDLTLD